MQVFESQWIECTSSTVQQIKKTFEITNKSIAYWYLPESELNISTAIVKIIKKFNQ